MQAEIAAFLRDPSQDNFGTLRRLVIQDPQYQPYSEDLRKLHNFISAGNWKGVMDGFRQMMPNYLVTPEAHMCISFAMHKSGDKEGAEFERYFANCLIKAIAETGDGTELRPYFVTRTSEEYEILEFLGKKSKLQGLVGKGSRHYDVQTCEDGAIIWFDITDAYNSLQKSLGISVPRE